MKFIAIAGLPGGGKTVCKKILQSLGVPGFSMGDVVKNAVVESGEKLTIKTSELMARKLRKEFGNDVVAKRTAETALKGKSDIVAIDGFRNIEEVEYFKNYGKVFIVYVHALPKTRFERLVKRCDVRDPKTWKDFQWRDKKEVERGLDIVIDSADYVVSNEGAIEDLKKELTFLLAEIRKV